MKADIHPTNYRPVVFQDLNNQQTFLIKSTVETKETIKWEDGQTYPLVKLHVTSASHPFYTGQEKMIDIEGRVDRFKSRQKTAQKAQDLLRAKTVKTLKRRAAVAKQAQEAAEADAKAKAKRRSEKITPKKIDKAKSQKPASKNPDKSTRARKEEQVDHKKTS